MPQLTANVSRIILSSLTFSEETIVNGKLVNDRLVSATDAYFIQLVEWNEIGNLQAWVVNPYDSSPGNPDSPRYDDQAQLFVQKKMHVA